MSISNQSTGVAFFFQQFGNRDGLLAHPDTGVGINDRTDTHSKIIRTTHQGAPGRRALVSRVKVGKSHATGSYRVDIWGPDSRVPMAPQITVSLIIGHDEHEIRQLPGIPGSARGNRGQNQKQHTESGFHGFSYPSVSCCLTWHLREPFYAFRVLPFSLLFRRDPARRWLPDFPSTLLVPILFCL